MSYRRQFQSNFTVTLIMAFFLSEDVSACVCDGKYSFKDEFERSDLIVIGEVLEVTHGDDLFIKKVPIFGDLYCSSNICWSKVNLKIEQSWKGVKEEVSEIEIRWDEYCRWPLSIGDRMLIFAQTIDGELGASCGLSGLVKDSGKTIKNLGSPKSAADKSKNSITSSSASCQVFYVK